MTITIEWRYNHNNHNNIYKDRSLSSVIQVICLKLTFVVIHLLIKNLSVNKYCIFGKIECLFNEWMSLLLYRRDGEKWK